jgi:hypothetical protein
MADLRRAALAAAILMIVGGCGGLSNSVFFTSGFASPKTPYGQVLERHTRSAELYRGFDTVAKGWATWRSDSLRKALVETSIEAYRLSEADAEALREEERRAASQVREFHLALYTPKKHWNDLESPDTLWRLYLKFPEGARLTPVQLVHVPKTDKNAVEYPYVTPWTREYRISFPLVEETETRGHPTLLLTGPLGTMKFEF